MPFQDTFFETITHSDFEHLVGWTVTMSPAVLLFDVPGNPLAGYRDQQRFFQRLRAALVSPYTLMTTSDGWEVWERTRHAGSKDAHDGHDGPVPGRRSGRL